MAQGATYVAKVDKILLTPNVDWLRFRTSPRNPSPQCSPSASYDFAVPLHNDRGRAIYTMALVAYYSDLELRFTGSLHATAYCSSVWSGVELLEFVEAMP